MSSNAAVLASPTTSTINHGPAVSVVCWLLLVISTLLTIARLATKWAVSKRFNSDDALAIGSLAFNIGAGLAVSVAAMNGLGSSLNTVSYSQLVTFEKSSYSGGLLYIATLFFTKLSIILLFRSITPQRLYRRWAFGLGVLVSSCGAVFLLAAALPCRTPHVWHSVGPTCYNRSAFWQAYGTVEIFANLTLILLPFYVFKGLQMSWAKKAIILGCFGTRVLDIAAIATQIAYANAFGSVNQTLELWPWFLIGQVVQTLSIFSSCIPYLRPFFEALNSGMFMSDELRRRGEYFIDSGSFQEGSQKRYVLRNPLKDPKSKKFANLRSITSQTRPEPGQCRDLAGSSAQVRVEIGTTNKSDELIGDEWDAVSQGSRSRIIKAATTVRTSFEYRERPEGAMREF